MSKDFLVHHFTEACLAKGRERTALLNSLGIRVIRFENKEVFEDVEAVLERIRGCFGS